MLRRDWLKLVGGVIKCISAIACVRISVIVRLRVSAMACLPVSAIACLRIITPTTRFSQSRRSIYVTWRHTLSPRYTPMSKIGNGNPNKNAHYRINKGCWRDKFVIRSVTDILRIQSRFVKCVGVRPAALPPQILQTYYGPEVRQEQTL